MDRPPRAVYFDAQAEAGLGRAWTMVGIGFAASLLPGLATTRRTAPHAPAPRPAPIG
ncbi:hypothetical protein [Kitasatospora griseola]|uniref:hypothetical protein n=1 Tax=Kitasatospora griseola TaxID=2064 RepID=UPI001670913E|nr:hypothetical protein [Kitasatospora griseola]